VAAIYADAPVCSLDFRLTSFPSDTDPARIGERRKDAERIAGLCGTTAEKLGEHPLSPLNNVQPIAEAKIPIYAVRSGQDLSVVPQYNIDIFEERLKAAGGDIEVFRRDFYGHHPHGFDDPQVLVDFILKHYPGF
jgi:hypothetical protein